MQENGIKNRSYNKQIKWNDVIRTLTKIIWSSYLS